MRWQLREAAAWGAMDRRRCMAAHSSAQKHAHRMRTHAAAPLPPGPNALSETEHAMTQGAPLPFALLSQRPRLPHPSLQEKVPERHHHCCYRQETPRLLLGQRRRARWPAENRNHSPNLLAAQWHQQLVWCSGSTCFLCSSFVPPLSQTKWPCFLRCDGVLAWPLWWATVTARSGAEWEALLLLLPWLWLWLWASAVAPPLGWQYASSLAGYHQLDLHWTMVVFAAAAWTTAGVLTSITGTRRQVSVEL